MRLVLGLGLPAPLPVDRILALTFTIAATQELRGRIDRRLREAHAALQAGKGGDPFMQRLVDASQDPERDRKLLTAAMQLMDEASIMTIHGFCAKALGEESFEAGRLFDQTLAPDGDAFALLASQDVFRSQLLALPPLERRVALDAWDSPETLLRLMRGLLQRQGATLAPQPKAATMDEAGLARQIEAAKQGWLADGLPELIRAAGLRANSKPMTRLAAMTAFCQSASLEPFHELWQVYSAESLDAARKKDAPPFQHKTLALIEQISQCRALYGQTQVNLWHRLLAALRARLQALKTAQQALTLDDLLTGLRDALTREGSGMAERLAERWPVVMVDEFQDTDDIQTAIFDRMAAAPGHQALLMVGDPKQAIYQFRGADIYTYLNARRQAGAAHALTINWRATDAMVALVNHFFAGRAVFDAEGEIECRPAKAAAADDKPPLVIGGASPKPCQLLVTGLADDQPPTLGQARETLMEAAAEKTAQLLAAAAKGKATLGGKPLAAGSIAFLVRSRADAQKAKRALARRGVQSVHLTLDTVLLEDTAEAVQLVLQAALEPRQDAALKAALASRLLQSDAAELEALNKDVQAQQLVYAEFQRYHDLWRQENAGAMLMALVRQRGLAGKWLGLPDGERQLSNFRQLLELLQTRAAAAPGMHRLVKWFARERQAAASQAGGAADERQLHLESDERLVKIVTFHAAKGLEYDVVMLPCPYFAAPAGRDWPLLYHRKGKDGAYALVADLDPGPGAQERAAQESRAEDLRLLYVALTRARHLCCLGLPMVSNWRSLRSTAMADLLALPAEAGAASLKRHLEKTLPPELFDILPWKPRATRLDAGAAAQRAGRAPPPLPPLADGWRLHSYTSLAARLGSAEAHPPPEDRTTARVGYADDDAGLSAGREPAGPGEPSRFAFPRGPRTGIYLHSWLEGLDFGADAAAHADASRVLLDKAGLGGVPGWQPVVAAWLTDILATPLSPSMRLKDLAKQDKVDELEFHFPVSAAQDALGFLQAKGYLPSRRVGAAGQLQGMMTGFIDLAFRHEGRYYLADYKSNHLGMDFADYGPAALAATMQESRYDLQCLIYSVAFSRHLALSLPGYSYDAHFGGAFYLFLRGMDGRSEGSGVFFHRPEAALIEALDQRLGGK